VPSEFGIDVSPGAITDMTDALEGQGRRGSG
jgi:hypothetical protein